MFEPGLDARLLLRSAAGVHPLPPAHRKARGANPQPPTLTPAMAAHPTTDLVPPAPTSRLEPEPDQKWLGPDGSRRDASSPPASTPSRPAGTPSPARRWPARCGRWRPSPAAVPGFCTSPSAATASVGSSVPASSSPRVEQQRNSAAPAELPAAMRRLRSALEDRGIPIATVPCAGLRRLDVAVDLCADSAAEGLALLECVSATSLGARKLAAYRAHGRVESVSISEPRRAYPGAALRQGHRGRCRCPRALAST